MFLITGFPRCRSTWLSAYLSTGETLCEHEPYYQFSQNFVWMAGHIDALPYPNVGISDPGIAVYWKTYQKLWPHARVLIVDRSKAEALASHRKYFSRWGGTMEKVFDHIETGLQALPEHFPVVKRLPFDALNTLSGARAAWEFCCPNQPFEPFRYQAMQRIVCNPKL